MEPNSIKPTLCKCFSPVSNVRGSYLMLFSRLDDWLVEEWWNSGWKIIKIICKPCFIDQLYPLVGHFKYRGCTLPVRMAWMIGSRSIDGHPFHIITLFPGCILFSMSDQLVPLSMVTGHPRAWLCFTPNQPVHSTSAASDSTSISSFLLLLPWSIILFLEKAKTSTKSEGSWRAAASSRGQWLLPVFTLKLNHLQRVAWSLTVLNIGDNGDYRKMTKYSLPVTGICDTLSLFLAMDLMKLHLKRLSQLLISNTDQETLIMT